MNLNGADLMDSPLFITVDTHAASVPEPCLNRLIIVKNERK